MNMALYLYKMLWYNPFEQVCSKNGQDYVTKFQTNHSGESFEIPAEGISSGTACIRIIGRDAVSGTETSADYTVTLTE